MEDKITLANRLLVRHISQHKILKMPTQRYTHIDTKPPVWSNPPILEKYLLKAFTNCYPAKIDTDQHYQALNLCHFNTKPMSHSLARRRAISQRKKQPQKISLQKDSLTHHYTLDHTDTIHTTRTEVNTPALLSYDTLLTDRNTYQTQTWGINIQKIPVQYIFRSIKTARPRGIVTKNMMHMGCLRSSKPFKEMMKYKPSIVVRRKATSNRPNSSIKDEGESPLCGW
jgi:hypothetical protein